MEGKVWSGLNPSNGVFLSEEWLVDNDKCCHEKWYMSQASAFGIDLPCGPLPKSSEGKNRFLGDWG